MNKTIIAVDDCVCEVCEVQNEIGLLCINESWLCAECVLKLCTTSEEPLTITGVAEVSE